MQYVYLLVSHKDKSWYIGCTNDLKRRVNDHNSGQSRYTNQRKPYSLVFYEAYICKEDAVKREKFLKSGAGRIKLKEQLKSYLMRP